MSKHTPGRWEWDSDGHIYPEAWSDDVAEASGYDPHIAKVNRARDTVRDGEFEGNRNLITAAPDLLEAAEEAEDFLATMYARTTENPPKALRTLRSAIARAKGETNARG